MNKPDKDLRDRVARSLREEAMRKHAAEVERAKKAIEAGDYDEVSDDELRDGK